MTLRILTYCVITFFFSGMLSAQVPGRVVSDFSPEIKAEQPVISAFRGMLNQRAMSTLTLNPEPSPYCATDALFAQQVAQNPSLEQAQTQLDQDLYITQTSDPHQTSTQHKTSDPHQTTNQQRTASTVLVIPTVIHIIHNNGPENIPNAQAINAINELNLALRNQGFYNPSTGADVEIELCLAVRDTNDMSTTGINRVVSPLTTMVLETQDLDLKNLSYWDSRDYLNIWVVNAISSLYSGPGVAGYSSLPAAHGGTNDGFVVEYTYFGANQNDHKVSVHELGHYLGLYHTFQGGCPNNDCLQDGDRVCDTPPDASTASVTCNANPNSCTTDADDSSTNNPFRSISLGGIGDQPDQFQNYMDYGDLACVDRFTEGQKERMRFFLQGARASLLQSPGCTLPCTQALTASFSASTTSPFAGTSVSFTNTSSNATTYTWKINGQIASFSANPQFLFNTTGTQTVTLIVENGGANCIDSTSIPITVLCQAQAGFTAPTTLAQIGVPQTFTNNINGGTSFTWLIDGIPTAFTIDLNYTFSAPGTYQVELVATNGTCTDTASLSYTVGFCADHRYDQWRFGNQAGLDFSSGMRVAVACSMTTFESSGAMADAQGNLLFYTNGGGVGPQSFYQGGVWNRNDQLMPNGILDSSDAGCNSALQGVLTLQDPANPNRYYLVTNSCTELSFIPGMSYHIVDMTADNGLGDVVLKNQLIRYTGVENMAAAEHCNGSDFWIATNSMADNALLVFHLGVNGLDTVPVTNYPLTSLAWGELKFSPDGKTLVVFRYGNGASIIDLYGFDNADGSLVHREALSIPFLGFVGYDFSPDSHYLFAFGRLAGQNIAELLQFDLTATPVAPTIFSSSYPIPGSNTAKGFQLGPDGKIYQAFDQSSSLGVIEYPNQAQAVLQLSTVPLAPSTNTVIGLPSIPSGSFRTYSTILGGPTEVCTGSQGAFSFIYPTCGANGVAWEYRGGGNLLQQTDSSAVVQFGSAGTDTLIATRLSDCSNQADTLLVNVGSATQPDLGPDLTLCIGPAILDAGSGYIAYNWNSGQGSSQTLSASSPGTFWCEVTDSLGCIATDTVQVLPFPGAPSLQLGPDTTLCEGGTLVLQADSGYVAYLWQDNSTDPTFTVFQSGTYICQVTNACGFQATDTITVDFSAGSSLNLGPDTTLCTNQITLNAPGGFTSYVWNAGQGTSPTFVANTAGSYVCEVVDQAGCLERDTILVLPNPGIQTPDLGQDTVLCPGDTIALGPFNGYFSYLWQNNSTGSGFVASNPGIYWVEVSNICGQVESDSIEITPCVGLDWMSGEVNLTVYPNPNSGDMVVKGKFPFLVEDLRLEIWDPLGKLVYSHKFDTPTDAIEHRINREGLAEGAYLLRVRSKRFSRVVVLAVLRD